MKLNELFDKEVISIKDGARLGEISDFEFNSATGEIETIILYGKLRFFGLFGRNNDCFIPWKCVRVIGDDTILIDAEIVMQCKQQEKSTSLISKLLD